MSNSPFFKQQDMMDCGATCLRMVAKHFGKTIGINNLRNQSQYSRDGVSILGIANAAENIGFKTLAVNIVSNGLINDAPLPCILHWNQNHFVVLYKATKNKFTIADPAKGIIKLSKQEFLKSWLSTIQLGEQKGIALLLEPTAAFFNQQNEQSKAIGWGLLSNYSLKYKAQIFQLFLGLLLGSLLQLIFPFLTQSIVDTGINTGNLRFIQLILIAQFSLFLPEQ